VYCFIFINQRHFSGVVNVDGQRLGTKRLVFNSCCGEILKSGADIYCPKDRRIYPLFLLFDYQQQPTTGKHHNNRQAGLKWTPPVWIANNKQHPTQLSTNIMLFSSVVSSVYYHANNN
jgi:hypothetical protein